MITPTMHRLIPMNTRVVVPASYVAAGNARGTVVGIAHVHVFFSYIVLLDVPIDIGHGLTSAICVSGCELRGIDGESWLVNS